MSEQTREYRIGSQGVYLTRFGQAGMAAWSEIMTGHQTADALEARLQAHTPASDDDALGLRFALRGVELARTAKVASERDRAAAIRAMATLEAETVARPAVPVVPKQQETCHHGVSFDATCPQCDADFA
jgi:hypothetical protein